MQWLRERMLVKKGLSAEVGASAAQTSNTKETPAGGDADGAGLRDGTPVARREAAHDDAQMGRWLDDLQAEATRRDERELGAPHTAPDPIGLVLMLMAMPPTKAGPAGDDAGGAELREDMPAVRHGAAPSRARGGEAIAWPPIGATTEEMLEHVERVCRLLPGRVDVTDAVADAWLARWRRALLCTG